MAATLVGTRKEGVERRRQQTQDTASDAPACTHPAAPHVDEPVRRPVPAAPATCTASSRARTRAQASCRRCSSLQEHRFVCPGHPVVFLCSKLRSACHHTVACAMGADESRMRAARENHLRAPCPRSRALGAHAGSYHAPDTSAWQADTAPGIAARPARSATAMRAWYCPCNRCVTSSAALVRGMISVQGR
jgi:hypothetical protein